MGRYDVVRIAIACVLLVASAFKAHQVFSDGFIDGAVSWNHVPVIAAAVVEIMLGALLLLNRQAAWTWRVTLALFSFFAIVALRKFLSGAQSCSCLGSLDIPPQYSFGFDLIAVGALLVFRPHEALWLQSIRLPVSVGLGSAVAALAWGAVHFGSVNAAIAYCQGYPLLPERPALWLGELVADQRIARPFKVRNPSNHDITIAGAKPSCGCFVGTKLPIVVPAGGTIELAIGIRARATSAGRTVVETALLYLDVEGPPIVLTVSGRVENRSERPSTVGGGVPS